jgi:uncharacterized protein YjaG (DUF416 family)/DNA-binding CsgD family transcriptional regulator
MSPTATNHLSMFMLFVFLQTNYFSFSQTTSYPIHNWAKILREKNAPGVAGAREILDALAHKDSSEGASLFSQLEMESSASDKYFIARLAIIKAWWVHNYRRNDMKVLLKNLANKALIAAYETNNDSLISYVSWQAGNLMYYSGQIELASMYCINAAEMDDRIGRRTTDDQYGLLEGVLYTTRDNDRCIYYAKRAIEQETSDTAYLARHGIMTHFNTIGLCWKRIGNYDSAFFYFDIALTKSIELGEKIWESIISGNKGQVLYSQQKYAEAKLLLESDYRYSKAYGELGSASNSLQWVARINLAEGKRDSALLQVKDALQLLRKDPNWNYLENIYYATADVYRAFGAHDSVYKYTALYNQLHDSIERAVANSRVEISRMRLDNIQNALTIRNLNKEKQEEKLRRNFSLAVIAMCSIIAILIVNSRRLRSAHKHQLALQQKQAMEAEANAAKEQLEMFRQNVIEKTTLVERLQQQIQQNRATAEQSEIIAELSHHTILTEEDWDKFKSLFEKIYPGFFLKIRGKAPDITIAEQRMAALTRLHLTTKQMASMLGVSADSIHKTRQRLRERFQISDSATLEELILSI